VYVVSLTKSLDKYDGKLSAAPLAKAKFEGWLKVCPTTLTLDGAPRPAVHALMERIRRFWIPDEIILYIGKATSLSERLTDYYRTPLGACSPHSGGYFLKLLSNLDQLWVHYARCDDPKRAEDRMLCRFCANVSDDSRRSLRDPDHPFPFANLAWPPGVRKDHGLPSVKAQAGRA